MIAEISSLISSSKAAFEIAKGISSLNSEVERNQSISKVLEVLITVQMHALSVNAVAQKLQEEKSDLTKKMMELEEWTQTKSNYELKELAPGFPAYARKEADNTKDPALWICPYCYDQKKESFLQGKKHSAEAGSYLCPVCKTTFQWGPAGITTRRTVSRGITDGY